MEKKSVIVVKEVIVVVIVVVFGGDGTRSGGPTTDWYCSLLKNNVLLATRCRCNLKTKRKRACLSLDYQDHFNICDKTC